MRKIAFAVAIVVAAPAQIQQLSPHTFRVTAVGCPGRTGRRTLTGFRVKDQVGIVTALHGILGCAAISARNTGNLRLKENLTVLALDLNRDVALVSSGELERMPADGFERSAPGTYRNLRVEGMTRGTAGLGAKVDVNYPEITQLSFLAGDLAKPLNDRNSPSVSNSVLSVTGLEPGDSGAPILDAQGKLLAVADGGLAGGGSKVNWAIPYREIEWVGIDALKGLALSRYQLLKSDSGDGLFTHTPAEPEGADIYVSDEYRLGRAAWNRGQMEDAFQAFSKSAAKGRVEAMEALGLMHTAGIGTVRDSSVGRTWYQKAMSLGSVDAAFALALNAFRQGSPVRDQDGRLVLSRLAAVKELFLAAADHGDGDAMFWLAWFYEISADRNEDASGKARDYALAQEWSRRASRAGYLGAAWNLGDLIEHGKGSPANINEARGWYLVDASSDLDMSMRHVAYLYLDEQNFTEARRWFAQRARFGEFDRTYIEMLRQGIGGPKDEVTGASLESAQKQKEVGGSPVFTISDCFNSGAGFYSPISTFYRNDGLQNYGAAFAYFQTAAQQGHSGAMYLLGWMYEHGRGIPKDAEEARSWYQKSSQAGSGAAKQALDRLPLK